MGVVRTAHECPPTLLFAHHKITHRPRLIYTPALRKVNTHELDVSSLRVRACPLLNWRSFYLKFLWKSFFLRGGWHLLVDCTFFISQEEIPEKEKSLEASCTHPQTLCGWLRLPLTVVNINIFFLSCRYGGVTERRNECSRQRRYALKSSNQKKKETNSGGAFKNRQSNSCCPRKQNSSF